MATEALRIPAQIALRADVVSTLVDEGSVLLDLQTKYFYSVNRSGAAILLLLEGGASHADVLDSCVRWGMPANDRDAVDSFLSALASEDLVEEAGSGASDDTLTLEGSWTSPTIEKQREPLQRIMASAFDPSLPLAE